MKIALKTALLSLMLGLLALPGLAQTGSLKGKVTGLDGEGVRDALIKIERTDVVAEYEVKTKKKGNWLHAGLPLGVYRISLLIDGKTIETINGVRAQMGGGESIDFDLAELEEKRKEAQARADKGEGPTEDQLKGMSGAERKAYEQQIAERQKQLGKNKELNEAFNLGMTAKQGKDWPVAVQHLSKAAELDPEQDVVLANLAEAQEGLAQTKTGDERTQLYDQSIASYHKAMVLKPDAANYANNAGLTLVRAGKADEGKQLLAKAALMDPANGGRYYFNLGAVMTNAGDLDGAIEAFRKATETQPDYASAYYQLGTALVGKATYKDDGSIEPVPGTVEAYEKYLELEPTGANAASAQAMIQSLSTSVETSFSDPTKKRRKR